ncbi:MAG: hypothetical protein RIR69_708 [Actinomycetota bacterium]|jgi:peroxiredoxin
MAQAQRKNKQTQQQRKKSTMQKAVALLVVVVALAATIAIGLSSGTSAPRVDDGNSAIITGQFQEVNVDGELLPPLPEDGDDPARDTPAPILNGYDFRGNPITINAANDTRDTLLVFLAHWCPHCNDEVPKLIDWREKGLIPDNLRVVGITTGSRNDAPNWPPSDWIEEKKWPFEVLADSEQQTAALAYGVSAYPFMAVVNADGVLKTRFSGVVEPTALTEIVTAALK